jgi:hypothetical protein
MSNTTKPNKLTTIVVGIGIAIGTFLLGVLAVLFKMNKDTQLAATNPIPPSPTVDEAIKSSQTIIASHEPLMQNTTETIVEVESYLTEPTHTTESRIDTLAHAGVIKRRKLP